MDLIQLVPESKQTDKGRGDGGGGTEASVQTAQRIMQSKDKYPLNNVGSNPTPSIVIK